MDPVPQGTSLPARIVHHQTRLAAIGAELRSLEEAAAEGDGRDFTAEELATIETLTADKATNESQLNACLTLENSIAARAQPAGNGQTVLNPATRRVEPRARVKEKPGFMLAKMATVSVLSHFKKQPIERIVASHYANDDRVAGCMDYMLKSAVAIADSTTPGWAGELVREDIAAFMADIENVSVYAALRTRGRTVDFDGAGRISIPSRTNQGNMAPAWVGEAGVIPVVQGSFAARLLEPTKLASITTFSKELLNNTSGQIEATLRDALRVDAATTLDAALLDATAARPQVRPAGLQVGATVVPSGGPDAAAADLKAALSPIIAAGGGQNIVLIMNPVNVLGLQFATNMLGLPAYPEIAQGRFAGYAFIASNNVPAGTVFVMDASEFASGAGVPNFEISEEATLTMANADGTAPTQAVDAAGAIDVPGQVGPDLGIKVAGNAAAGAGTAGYQAFSMFQMWSVALRMILPVHWMMLRDDMVSVITGVDWGGEPTP